MKSYPPSKENCLEAVENLKNKFGPNSFLVEVKLLVLLVLNNLEQINKLSTFYEVQLRWLDISNACATILYRTHYSS